MIGRSIRKHDLLFTSLFSAEAWTHSPRARTYIFDSGGGEGKITRGKSDFREQMFLLWLFELLSCAAVLLPFSCSPRGSMSSWARAKRGERGCSTRKNQRERGREREGERGNRVNECLLPLFSSSPSLSGRWAGWISVGQETDSLLISSTTSSGGCASQDKTCLPLPTLTLCAVRSQNIP